MQQLVAETKVLGQTRLHRCYLFLHLQMMLMYVHDSFSWRKKKIHLFPRHFYYIFPNTQQLLNIDNFWIKGALCSNVPKGWIRCKRTLEPSFLSTNWLDRCISLCCSLVEYTVLVNTCLAKMNSQVLPIRLAYIQIVHSLLLDLRLVLWNSLKLV